MDGSLSVEEKSGPSFAGLFFVSDGRGDKWLINVGYLPSLLGQGSGILAKFFFCLFLDGIEDSDTTSINTPKTAKSISQTDRTSLFNKGSIIWIYCLLDTTDGGRVGNGQSRAGKTASI